MSVFEDNNDFREFKEGFEYQFNVKRIRDYEGSVIRTASYGFYAFENTGKTLEVVSTILIGKYLVELDEKVFISHYKLIKRALDIVLLAPAELDLTNEEKDEIIKISKEIEIRLPKLKIEYDPHAK